jgi:hypothetical protein
VVTNNTRALHRGFVINGEAEGDYSGGSVSHAGGVNGDGLDDLIVGAGFANVNDIETAGKSKPPTPEVMADRLIAAASFFPKMT